MLINDITPIKAHWSSINRNADYNSFPSFIADAEAVLVKEYLGDAQYQALNTAVHTGAMTAQLSQLLYHVERYLVPATIVRMVVQMSMQVGDLGAMEMRTENATPAPKWKLQEQKAELQQAADERGEALLLFLENNAAAYPLWVASDVYTEIKNCFVENAAQFNIHININKSRRLFILLKPHLLSAEQAHIKQILGEAWFTDWKTRLASRTPFTIGELTLFPDIQQLLCNAAMLELLPYIALQVTPNGVMLTKNVEGLNASEAQTLLASLKETCAQAVARATVQIKKTIDTGNFPLFPYQDRPKPTVFSHSNKGGLTF